ncbi:MAG: pantoate--beta-alanine ligase [Gammaproteobacteria bacterium]|nr:MAG: pantoate--beta-alanine ligase [Gammaproteobacteria bacterium]
MRTVTTISQLRSEAGSWRSQGERVAFVPTMGNLHAGHLQLVHEAKKVAGRVVVSIFVNPTQFGEGEDFDSYPRTIETDSTALNDAGVDLLFLPCVEEMYPGNRESATFVEVPGVSEMLCGEHRSGHFRGVATIVCKLFNMVGPDLALFGEKDFQQLSVIRKMVKELNMPITVQGVPTVREASGLALSSRNGYLKSDEREQASLLYRCLCDAKEAILAGERSIEAIESEQIDRLNKAGFKPEYFTVSRRSDLNPAAEDDVELVILAAAQFGAPRLIDNLSFNRLMP